MQVVVLKEMIFSGIPKSTKINDKNLIVPLPLYIQLCQCLFSSLAETSEMIVTKVSLLILGLVFIGSSFARSYPKVNDLYFPTLRSLQTTFKVSIHMQKFQRGSSNLIRTQYNLVLICTILVQISG